MNFPFDSNAVIKIVAALLAAIVADIIKRKSEAKPKLLYSLIHSTAVPVAMPVSGEGGTGTVEFRNVHTHSIVVRNAGKITAKNVRIFHEHLPESFKVEPGMSYVLNKGEGHSGEILLPTLVAGEQVIVTYLYIPPLTWNQVVGAVKSDEGMAKAVRVMSNPAPSPWLRYSQVALMLIGGATLAYYFLLGLNRYLL